MKQEFVLNLFLQVRVTKTQNSNMSYLKVIHQCLLELRWVLGYSDQEHPYPQPLSYAPFSVGSLLGYAKITMTDNIYPGDSKRKWAFAGGSMNATGFLEGDLVIYKQLLKNNNAHIFQLSKSCLNGNYPIKTRHWFTMIYA